MEGLLQGSEVPEASQVAWKGAWTRRFDLEQEVKAASEIEPQGPLPPSPGDVHHVNRTAVKQSGDSTVDAHRLITVDLNTPDAAREGWHPRHGGAEGLS